MSEIKSRPYNPDKCCEACCFGRGGHAPWCSFGERISLAGPRRVLYVPTHDSLPTFINTGLWKDALRRAQ